MYHREIVWQPFALFGKGNEFGILVQNEYAKKLVNQIIKPESQKKLNELAYNDLSKKGLENITPYTFYKDTALVIGFYLGREGRWLTCDDTLGKNPLERYVDKPLKYSSHNIDYKEDAHMLLSLVDMWTYYAEYMK